MMSLTQLLRDDHKYIKGLLRQLEVSGLRMPETKAALVRATLSGLELLAQVEGEIFYPALLDAVPEVGRPLVARANAAQADIAALIGEIKDYERAGGLDTPQLDERLHELVTRVEAQINDEELRLLPLADVALRPDLVNLAERIQQRKQQLLARTSAA